MARQLMIAVARQLMSGGRMKSYFGCAGACLVVILAACGGRVGDVGGGGGGASSSGGASSGGGGCCPGCMCDAGGRACSSDADCGQGNMCGFLQSEGCSATGTCFPMPASTCKGLEDGCACDGATINIACTGLPDGYVPRPLEHAGPCVHPTPRPSCASSKDCSAGLICGFPIAEGCAAQGACFTPGPVCNGFEPGCACDGQTIDIECVGLPAGFATQPVEHVGTCETSADAGVGD